MQQLEILQNFEEARGEFRLPLDMKPCIYKLLKDYELSNNGINAFITACELFRIGKKKIETILLELGYYKGRSAVKSASLIIYTSNIPKLNRIKLCAEMKRLLENITRESVTWNQ